MLPTSRNKIHHIFADKLEPWSNAPELSWMVTPKNRRDLQLSRGVKILPQKPAGKGVAKGTTSRYQKNQTTVRNWPEEHLIAAIQPRLLCILNGVAHIRFYDYSLILPQGTFILIPACIPTSDGAVSFVSQDDPNDSCETCWMRPVGNELHFWITHSDHKRNTTWQWGNVLFLNHRLNLFLRLLSEEFLGPAPADIRLTTHLLRLIIAGLRRESQAENYLVFGQEEYPSWDLAVASDPIAQAKDYIDAHYGSSITLENLAHTVGISRTSLAQRFKQQTGETVVEYLTLRRLTKARELLEKSDWTVAAISKFVGFRSQTYFHHLFRKTVGNTPQEFRKTYRK